MTHEAAEWIFHLNSGALCLDLANTVSWRGSAQPAERLTSYRQLVRWSHQAGLVTDTDARRLERAAARRPAEAAQVLRAAVELRETIYRIFAGLAAGRPVAAKDLTTLNRHVAGALRRLRLMATGTRFDWLWDRSPRALDRMLWPAARSAAELLVSEDLAKLRTCAAPNCRWVFLDATRNHSRRWCTMAVCGNRAKMRRYQARLGRRRTSPVRSPTPAAPPTR